MYFIGNIRYYSFNILIIFLNPNLGMLPKCNRRYLRVKIIHLHLIVIFEIIFNRQTFSTSFFQNKKQNLTCAVHLSARKRRSTRKYFRKIKSVSSYNLLSRQRWLHWQQMELYEAHPGPKSFIHPGQTWILTSPSSST